ncbi:hypothetical protein K431DRAFT_281296 [Polychaeton citri CBS 116435]|uniref:Uncharacterized protein n=1 Tax=Polychaeton citri CBS 116435 TaxID=1314669 RepID=A0A9P4QI69_9PEZI|nr:hypothetical protein K431DRAFT_281296 [Polychaeton citri CBS 116435]
MDARSHRGGRHRSRSAPPSTPICKTEFTRPTEELHKIYTKLQTTRPKLVGDGNDLLTTRMKACYELQKLKDQLQFLGDSREALMSQCQVLPTQTELNKNAGFEPSGNQRLNVEAAKSLVDHDLAVIERQIDTVTDLFGMIGNLEFRILKREGSVMGLLQLVLSNTHPTFFEHSLPMHDIAPLDNVGMDDLYGDDSSAVSSIQYPTLVQDFYDEKGYVGVLRERLLESEIMHNERREWRETRADRGEPSSTRSSVFEREHLLKRSEIERDIINHDMRAAELESRCKEAGHALDLPLQPFQSGDVSNINDATVEDEQIDDTSKFESDAGPDAYGVYIDEVFPSSSFGGRITSAPVPQHLDSRSIEAWTEQLPRVGVRRNVLATDLPEYAEIPEDTGMLERAPKLVLDTRGLERTTDDEPQEAQDTKCSDPSLAGALGSFDSAKRDTSRLRPASNPDASVSPVSPAGTALTGSVLARSCHSETKVASRRTSATSVSIHSPKEVGNLERSARP